MRLHVDKEANALYLRLDDSKIIESEEVAPGSFSRLCEATAWQAGQATLQPRQSEIASDSKK